VVVLLPAVDVAVLVVDVLGDVFGENITGSTQTASVGVEFRRDVAGAAP